MKKIAAVIFLLLGAAALCRAERIDIRPLDGRESTVRQGTSWGIPFAKGALQPGATFVLTDAAGREVPSASRPLACWPGICRPRRQ